MFFNHVWHYIISILYTYNYIYTIIYFSIYILFLHFSQASWSKSKRTHGDSPKSPGFGSSVSEKNQEGWSTHDRAWGSSKRIFPSTIGRFFWWGKWSSHLQWWMNIIYYYLAILRSWPFWDGEVKWPFQGRCWWPPTIGDQKVTAWITW